MNELANKVQSFWYQGKLSPWEQLCLSSFVKHGYDVDLYSYDSHLESPPRIVVRDATQILPETDVFFYKTAAAVGKISAFSNLFRYVLLRERGGWWIDTDVICLKRLPDSEGFLVGYEDENTINGAIIYSEPRNPILIDAAEKCKAVGKDASWGEAGPRLLTHLVKAHGMVGKALPVHVFYPIHWSEVAHMLLLPEYREQAKIRCERSSALHLYNEMLARVGVPKSLLPPGGSILSDIFQEYGVDRACEGEVDADDIRRLAATQNTH